MQYTMAIALGFVLASGMNSLLLNILHLVWQASKWRTCKLPCLHPQTRPLLHAATQPPVHSPTLIHRQTHPPPTHPSLLLLSPGNHAYLSLCLRIRMYAVGHAACAYVLGAFPRTVSLPSSCGLQGSLNSFSCPTPSLIRTTCKAVWECHFCVWVWMQAYQCWQVGG